MVAKTKVASKNSRPGASDAVKNIVSANWTALIKPGYKSKEISDTATTFIIEPLEPGFATTFGNSLRRVLLSVLQGAAIVSLKIEGVDHEYSTISGVREDVVDIILNLKQVVVRYGGSEKRRLTLKVNEPGPITAGMIEVPHDVEIVNKDFVICHLDKNSSINMELMVSTGKGYVSAADNASQQLSVGTIPIDAIFSPVKKVAFKVENSRVGSQTGYDKLILTIETNGSINPELALGFAAKIIQEHLTIFINFADIEDVKVEEEKLSFDIQLLKRVEDLELSVRSHNCLKNDNIRYIGDLVIKTEAEMLKTPNFGRKSLNEIKELLSSMNLKFGMDVVGWPPENVEDLIKKYEDLLS